MLKIMDLSVKDAENDFDAVVKRSRGVADGMSNGVKFLMKKNKIDVIEGFGKLKPGKKLKLTDTNMRQIISLLLLVHDRENYLVYLKMVKK